MARRWISGLLLALAALTAAGTAVAASGAADIVRWTVDGGGGRSEGGDYTLTGTVGQFDAGVASGGNFALVGGFWGGYPPQSEQSIYLPVLKKP